MTHCNSTSQLNHKTLPLFSTFSLISLSLERNKEKMEVWVRVLILVACMYPVMVECAVRRYQFNVSNFAFQFEKRMIKSQTAWFQL